MLKTIKNKILLRIKPQNKKVIEKLLIDEIYKMFHGAGLGYTTFITKWTDGTFRMEVRHGEPIKNETCNIHHWYWYDCEVTYKMETIPATYGNS